MDSVFIKRSDFLFTIGEPSAEAARSKATEQLANRIEALQTAGYVVVHLENNMVGGDILVTMVKKVDTFGEFLKKLKDIERSEIITLNLTDFWNGARNKTPRISGLFLFTSEVIRLANEGFTLVSADDQQVAMHREPKVEEQT